MTATQGLSPNETILAADPYVHTGIHEAEMATILLSEAATAREGVELLKRIVETEGVWEEGFGIMICDQKEQWYVEVMTGHRFLAVLLPRSTAFFEANVSVLGRLDLGHRAYHCFRRSDRPRAAGGDLCREREGKHH